MNQSRKPRADAKLKTLPRERQEAIADYAHNHTLRATGKWLARAGVRTSAAALSKFISWFALERQFQRNEGALEALMARLKKAQPDWTPAKLQEFSLAFFSAFAVEQQDFKAWAQTQNIALKREQLDLNWKVFRRSQAEAFIKLCNDPEAYEVATSKRLSNAQKIERCGRMLYGELW